MASENVIVQLINAKCMSLLLYGVEVCPLKTKSQTESLHFAVNGCFMKLFTTKCKDTVHACMCAFGFFFVSDILKERKRKFLQKFTFKKNSLNLLDQFISMAFLAEREIDSMIRSVLSGNGFLCLNFALASPRDGGGQKFMSCFQLLGALPQDRHRGSAPGPRWGLPSLRPSQLCPQPLTSDDATEILYILYLYKFVSNFATVLVNRPKDLCRIGSGRYVL